MSLSSLLFFAATELVLCLIPGPAVLLVISQAMKRGFRVSMRGALGILAGNTIYFALSAAGLGALLIASHAVFEVLRWAGALYLMILGGRMLFAPAPSDASAPDAQPRSFLQGLITQLANPKAIVFFTALLPQFIDPHGRIALQLGILGIVSIAIELPVLAMYGFAADRGRAIYGRHARVIERAAGGCLVVAGAKLAAQ
ncbi:MAG TPA: LysE family translocator [Thermoanaerobaculia bacterium]|nr:LysE family translocator [Thermoanaerobaculia bacterium]